MRNVTFMCPACSAEDKAVGDPHESSGGHDGRWFCFNCGSGGQYAVEFDVQHDATGERYMPSTEGAQLGQHESPVGTVDPTHTAPTFRPPDVAS